MIIIVIVVMNLRSSTIAIVIVVIAVMNLTEAGPVGRLPGTLNSTGRFTLGMFCMVILPQTDTVAQLVKNNHRRHAKFCPA